MTPKTVTWPRGYGGTGTGEGQHLRATIQKGSRAPFWIGTRNDGTPGGGRNCSVEETRILRDMMNEALDEQIVTTDQLAVVDAKRAQAVAELEAFKEQVALAVARHPDGCQGGKEDFLADLGLEWPSTTVEVVVRITATNTDSGRSVEDEVELNARGGHELISDLNNASIELISCCEVA